MAVPTREHNVPNVLVRLSQILEVDNTGKERLAKDTKADQDWKDKVDFYVKGVEGKIPAAK